MNSELPTIKLPPGPLIPSKQNKPTENALIIPSRQTEIVIHGFRLTATGLVAEGDPTYDQWENCGHWLRFAENKVALWLGDWINYGENAYGEKYAQALIETDYSLKSLQTFAYVARKVDPSIRMEDLPFEDHQLVATDDLSQEEKRILLKMAKDEVLTVEQFRKEVKAYKTKRKLEHLPDAPKWNGNFSIDTVNVCPIEKLELPERSVDLIFTDPPYHDEYLDLFARLGEIAAFVLKPGAYLMTYAGKYYLPQVINSILQFGLQWVWCYCVYQPDNNHRFNGNHIFEAWRPIVTFKKPGGTETMNWEVDAVQGTRDKTFHEWQQQIEPPLKYIEAYTLPGQVVLDPFVGGGTTVVACKELKRHYLAFDKDESAVKMTIARLNGHKT